MARKKYEPVKYAEVYWAIEDVIVLRPEWDDNKCHRFLSNAQKQLQEAMVRRGLEVLELLIGRDDGK